MEDNKNFKRLVQQGSIDQAFDELPNCYAKGYLSCKYSSITDATDDEIQIAEELLIIADYDIWKY